MSDTCTVVNVVRTLVACFGPLVCEPDAMVDPTMKTQVCRHAAAPDCNYAIETLSCRREDGTTYRTTVERK